MKRFAPYLSALFLLPLLFFAATCEQPATVYQNCNMDSLTHLIDSLKRRPTCLLNDPYIAISFDSITPRQTSDLLSLAFSIPNARVAMSGSIVLDSSYLSWPDLQHQVDTLTLQLQAWKNVVVINHTNLEHLTNSLEQATFELTAERARNKIMEGKLRSRLDSAAAIIQRQEAQLKKCIYADPK